MAKTNADKKRTVYVLSDRTAVTAGTLSHTLLTQFPDIEFDRITIPFIDTDDKVNNVITQINNHSKKNKPRPFVFTSFSDKNYKHLIEDSDGIVLDLFDPYIPRMEKHLGRKSSHIEDHAHGNSEANNYIHRIDAINFSVTADDGLRPKSYAKADVVIVGVSRAGKTPTSLYMALHYGLMVANYPIADDDFERGTLPEPILQVKNKLFGLTIDPIQLQKIRSKRIPNSAYSQLVQCQKEVQAAVAFYKRYRIPYADSTAMSIEELASFLTHRMNLNVNYL